MRLLLLLLPFLAVSAGATAPAVGEEILPQLGPVILDAGHGGKDGGAVYVKDLGAGPVKIIEKDYTLKITLAVRDILAARGVPVLLTRSQDVYPSLDERVQFAMRNHGSLFVSIHVNDAPNNIDAHGVLVYSYGQNKNQYSHGPTKICSFDQPPAAKIATSVNFADQVAEVMSQRSLQVERRHARFCVIRNPTQPSILIELGFLTNTADFALLADADYQTKLAHAIADGITEHRGALVAAARATTELRTLENRIQVE